MVEGDGFEPSKSKTTDLQSAPFGHSGTPPEKMTLYRVKKWCPEPESNQPHEDFQSTALPTELSGHQSS